MTDPIDRRFAELRARAMEHVTEPVLAHDAWWVVCDGCGLGIRVDPTNPEPPAGWDLRGPDNDFCPDCRTKEPTK